MTAYDHARLDDYRQRLAKGQTLSPDEQRKYERLFRAAYEEEEAKPQPFMYGGDYEDVF